MTTPPWPTPLSPLLVLTDRRLLPPGRALAEQVSAAVEGGARAVVLREKDLPRPERRRLAGALLPILHARGGRLLVASDAALADEVGADGVHLAAADPTPGRRDGGGIVGRSTHTVDELVTAQRERIGYATCSPVFATRSKPGYGPALGLEGLAARCRRVLVPVYALGGITAAHVAGCRRAGAAGVAVMGEVMRAADPAATVRSLLDELADDPTGGEPTGDEPAARVAP